MSNYCGNRKFKIKLQGMKIKKSGPDSVLLVNCNASINNCLKFHFQPATFPVYPT